MRGKSRVLPGYLCGIASEAHATIFTRLDRHSDQVVVVMRTTDGKGSDKVQSERVRGHATKLRRQLDKLATDDPRRKRLTDLLARDFKRLFEMR